LRLGSSSGIGCRPGLDGSDRTYQISAGAHRGARRKNDYDDRVAWFAYVLVSQQSRRTYVGATTDVSRRARQHNGELRGGARATRAHRPWQVARVFGPFAGRGDAVRAELAIKKVRGLRRLEVVLR